MQTRWSKRSTRPAQSVIRLIVLMAVLVTGMVGIPTSAAASSTVCSSASDLTCVGQDPTRCANPGTVMADGKFWPDATNTSGEIFGQRVVAPNLNGDVREVGRLQLRYSPVCKMNWARIVFFTNEF